MRTLLAGMMAAGLMAGCVNMPAAPPAAAVPPPTCSGQADCDAKWAAARTFVLNNAGYKLQTYSADFMETYSPTNGDMHLGAQVNKEPLPGGGYAITAKFWCDNIFGCMPKANVALNQFAAAVNAVGAQPARAANQ